MDGMWLFGAKNIMVLISGWTLQPNVLLFMALKICVYITLAVVTHIQICEIVCKG